MNTKTKGEISTCFITPLNKPLSKPQQGSNTVCGARSNFIPSLGDFTVNVSSEDNFQAVTFLFYIYGPDSQYVQRQCYPGESNFETIIHYFFISNVLFELREFSPNRIVKKRQVSMFILGMFISINSIPKMYAL